MSLHSSLYVSSAGTRHRNVLKRFEKIKKLKKEEKMSLVESIFKLPKVKSIKVKVKKGGGKKEVAEATPAAGGKKK